MSNFIESLRSHVNMGMVSKAADLLEEDGTKVSSAVDSILASLMGVLSLDRDDFQMKNILDEAGNLKILSNAESTFEGDQSKAQQKIGDDFLQELLGDKAADFTKGITEKTGVTKVAANRLISMLAPIVAGFFGKKMKANNWTPTHLRNEIINQKDSYVRYIPESIMSAFGISQVLQKEVVNTPEKKKKNNWLLWIIIIALLLLLLLWWKSCRNDETYVEEEDITVITPAPSVSTGINEGGQATNTKSMHEITLPDGKKITVVTGGMEDKMIAFLNSDEYKNATNDDLKKKWFEFEDIHFQFGSSKELTGDSQKHLDNMAEILKSYKNAKIEIDGFADKVGSEDTNLKISKERAETVEAMLKNKGVGSQVAVAKGFGEQYAQHKESETNAERAPDRDIALRFVK